ncbi:MAG: hypothetical protein P4L71_01310 [Acetobacteraceae bacterium]|nr:hypothetical protein [Acetobacteraceae bacterium]
MIPFFAATSAISAIAQIGSGALAEWKQLTSSQPTSPKDDASSGANSFGALLSAQGVDNGSVVGKRSAQAVR